MIILNPRADSDYAYIVGGELSTYLTDDSGGGAWDVLSLGRVEIRLRANPVEHQQH